MSDDGPPYVVCCGESHDVIDIAVSNREATIFAILHGIEHGCPVYWSTLLTGPPPDVTR